MADIMKILPGLILAAATFSCFATEERGTGYGSSFEEALQSAKNVAVGMAAGTFVSQRQDLTGNRYAEKTAQYDGGFIRGYEVLSTSVDGGMYRVTIKADVDTDKANSVIEGAHGEVSEDNVYAAIKIADDRKRIRKAWQDISSVSKMFAVKLAGSQYVIDDDRVNLFYTLYVVWNPKWFDDAKKLSAATSLKKSDNLRDAGYAICFTNTPCVLVPEIPTLYLPESRVFTATVRFKDGSSMQLLSTRNIDAKYVAGQYANVSTGWFSETWVYALTFNDTYSRVNTEFTVSMEQFRNIADIKINVE